MDTKAHVGVKAANVTSQQFKVLDLRAILHDVAAYPVRLLHTLCHVAQGSVCRVDPARLNHAADEFHAVRCGLEVEFVLVQSQFEVLFQPLRRLRTKVDDELLVICDNQRIINETDIARFAVRTFLNHEFVKKGQVEVGQQLRSDIPDGHALSFRHREQRLVIWQVIPHPQGRPPFAVQLRLVAYGHLGQPQERVEVVALVVLSDERQQLGEHDILVNRHKEAADVYLSYPSITGVPLADSLDVLFGGLDSTH